MRDRGRLLERWRRLFGGNLVEEIDEELAFHIERRTQEFVDQGEEVDRARERAVARFGDLAATRGELEVIAKRRERRMARTEWLRELRQDLRFAVRTLVRKPAFTVVAVATLVLGIGANSAIFSVVNGVMLRALPFPEPDRVVHLGWDWGSGEPQGYLSAYKLEYFADRAASFQAVATYRGFSAGLGRGAGETVVRGLRAGSQLLDVVGYPMAAGRWFTAAEDEPGASNVVVLGYGLWMSRFGGDPAVLGTDVVLGGEPRTVIGVLSPEFEFPQVEGHGDVVVPFQFDPDPQDQGHNYPAIARLADGVSREQAAAELSTLSARFSADHPELLQNEQREAGMGITSYQDIYVGSLSGVLWIMLGAVGLVLLIACANVANLLLARMSERQRELSVRAAIGASRGRIVRQLLTESLVLSLTAGVMALGLAAAATRALVAMMPYNLPRSGEIQLDAGVVLFTLGVAVLTAALFGLAAAVPSARRGLVAGLKEGGRTGTSRGGLRNGLLVAEAAISVVLLVGAGLLVSTLLELRSVDPGFEVADLVTATVPRWPDRYQSPDVRAAFEAQLLDRMEGASSPVETFALASNAPLQRGWNLPMTVQGRPETSTGDVEWRAVSPGYFEAVGTPLVRGRAFTRFDNGSAPRVVIVNETFADQYFPDSDPLGQRLEIGKFDGNWVAPQFEGAVAEIVGVAGDIREMSLRREAKRTMMVPRSQASLPSETVMLMRTTRVGAAAGALREALRTLDPSLPPPTIEPMRQVLGESLARERFNAVLMSLFAGLAVVLTAVGIFGVVSYGVRRRTKEIGIRIAMGARAGEVTRLVTRQGMTPVMVGVGVGVVGALLLARFLQGMIWGVSATDPATVVSVTVFLGLVALLASWIPARRAAQADPVQALTEE